MDDDEARDKRRTYMREYKRLKYAENAEHICAKNRAYYCKKKLNTTVEDLKKYDVMLPIVVKVKAGLNELRENNPVIFKEIMELYQEFG